MNVPIPMAGAFGAGVTAEELPNHNKKGFAAAPASVWDPAERLKEQDRDGVAAEVLYTTFGMIGDLNMPLSLHILTGRGGTGINFNTFLTSYMSLPAEIQRTLSIMIFGGVFERFPKLQIVSAENDVSWIPHFLYRLDHAYDRFRHFEGVNLSMLPSEYMKRNVVATFQFEQATADFTRQLFGAEHIMWSADYPHTDSTWPHSREFIDEAFKDMPEEDIQKVVGGNVARIYSVNV